MTGRVTFEAHERAAILRELRERGASLCARCGVPLVRTSLEPRRDVSYVRERIRLHCPACGRSLVLDRRDVE